ncbi:hypothetical protein A3H80_01455 [Candidatus Roizmanbacteria bacterium RIFCSPLOWO2_02_FULL_37_19]|uniref:Fervidolysin-like N-terminal prodomain domain-containing protein n=1 Tax=Candidatus Roizmanbacteria bacterium RIFCSPHIGHO2_02_FULL_37_24 TaxID=1802037 RepID=A0A1F7GWP5_9BACT|nr:MAG: hypothetical protein A2862_01475 [Candidatus Roizmanbacteria bacterium RIFCSPHIGHO2_01_FULL_38_41]OGK22996.1 MAG: hypothetical protein A3C24_02550 [Candidatus Roizmanbacteria bacterium RIFCSPHIGHO2_02_FULL_37_24]OGK32223.1 MAG: hypothetical protein A3E10_02175 [Candidatus Roizmanbacteria bacterium RIFCSPHIGHO2_12_FULL_37_23]OGK45651.1 MAG: hypothetical protein A2956_00675 [Candidatus Roizmanbacteria bacterium RIFCSPLOWO2_01_FULL_37_57]OGK53856.1 MAG: hypothetical protein A3H80_01455 [Ca
MQRIFFATILFLLLIVGALFSPLVYAQNSDDNSIEGEYVKNEVIVKYKDNLTPDELELQVSERQNMKRSFVGRIQLFFGDLKLKFSKQDNPEIQLSRLQKTDIELGVIEKERLLQGSAQAGPNVYIIRTDGSKTVQQMIKAYSSLPEVEYAEVHNILQFYQQ